MKFLKVGRVAIITRGRYAGKKVRNTLIPPPLFDDTRKFAPWTFGGDGFEIECLGQAQEEGYRTSIAEKGFTEF